jgi:hypothetical protein
MNTRRRIILTFILLGSGALISLAYLLPKDRLQATSELEGARLIVSIIENGEPVTGQLLVSGDCPDQELPSVDGHFGCKLIASTENEEPTYKINSLGFFNYRDDTTRYFPLSAGSSIEREPLLLRDGEKLILRVLINLEETIIERWDVETRSYQPFPAP